MKLDNVIAKRAEKTVYRDGDLAIKLFESSFSKANVLNEALNQARVEETGLNIPKVNEVCKADGKWAIVSDFIEGETLSSLMEKHPEKEDEYLELFVDLQIEIHGKTAPLLNKLKDKMHRKISETTLDATTRYELHMRLDSMPTHVKVCHGDYNPSNIIITPEGKPFVIDAGQRFRRCSAHLSPVQAGEEGRAGREIPQPLLPQDRHRQAVRAAVAADRRRLAVGQGQAGGARVPTRLDKRCRLRINKE